MDIVVPLLGLIGMVLLAYPAWALDHLARRYWEAAPQPQPNDGPAVKRLYDIVSAGRSGWSRSHSYMLRGGYGLLVLGQLLNVLQALY